MVCLGAVLFAVVSLHCFGGVGDPGRVDAQVVTGIGFLGAGAIINQRGSVHGLTKAARLWFTEAIGLAVGVSMLLMSVMNEILVFLLLRFGPRSGWKSARSEQGVNFLEHNLYRGADWRGQDR